MSDPHDNQDKPAAGKSTPSSSSVDNIVGKINAFVSDPKPSGSTGSTWVPLREDLKNSGKALSNQALNMLKGFQITKK